MCSGLITTFLFFIICVIDMFYFIGLYFQYQHGGYIRNSHPYFYFYHQYKHVSIGQYLEFRNSMSFVVRRVFIANGATTDKIYQNVVLEPNKVVFDNLELNRINICKLILKNLGQVQINFGITQPKEPGLKVRFHKNSVLPDASVEVFVFLNPQTISKSLSDEFIINFTKEYSIYVPITVSVNENPSVRGNNKRRSSSISNKSKENLSRINHSRRRPRFRNEGAKQLSIVPGEPNEGREIEDLVRLFLKKYVQIEGFLKEKTIKNQIFVGEQSVTIEKRMMINGFNLRMELIADEQEKNKVLSRYQKEFSSDGPSIQNFKQVKPRWLKERNKREITVRKAMGKFMEEVRKIVISYRFKKMHRIMQIYRQMDKELNIMEVQSTIIPNICEDDCLPDDSLENEDAMLKKQQYLCRKIKKSMHNKANPQLGVDFNEFTLVPRLLEQDHSDSACKTQTYDIKPMVGFDNWIPLEQSTIYTHELMHYYKLNPLPPWECFPPISPLRCNPPILEPPLPVHQLDSTRPAEQPQDWDQFKESCLQEAVPYRLYDSEFQELHKDDSHEFDEKAEFPKLCVEYSSALKPIKLEQQFFQIFHSHKDRHILGVLPKERARLIYEVGREDKVDFDELSGLEKRKLEMLEEGRREEEQDEIDEDEELKELKELKGSINEELQCKYERLLANIEKIKLRKLTVSLNKIMLVNRVVRKKHNLIYF